MEVEYWDCAVRMSKRELYEALYAVIDHGGAITCTFALGRNHQYNKRQNAYNVADLRIRLPVGSKESFEEMSGLKLEPIPKISGN